ncbi:MAG: hypothetical protein V7L22_29620 [Nostoc sp.]|uniref:hypothetical protein n=1 Tax=Nostoc sp. TaxID=1180 RepID=UPI002FFA6A3D
MSYDTARQQHISWLNKQIEEKMSALAEAEVRLSQLRADIEYFKLMLNIHEKANTDALNQDTSIMLNSDDSSNRESNQSQTNNNTFTDNAKYRVGDDNKRSPKEMLRTEFANKTLAEVAEIVLNSRNEALTADDIARAVFITKKNDEYVRARNSLSTELRRGAREGRWQQIGRGSFASIQAEYLSDKNVATANFSTNGTRTNN